MQEHEINTIFYFEPSKTTYEYNWTDGKIDDRTIVFVGETGEIFKGGVPYGKMSVSEIINIVKENANSLPVATQETLGVIKVGDNLSISLGSLSVDIASLFNDSSVSLLIGRIISNYLGTNTVSNIEAATSNKLGGIKLGYENNGKNYRVQLDGENRAYVNVPWDVLTGPQGVRGDFVSRVFTRQSSQPDTPTGGTYENPIPTYPVGVWTDEIPEETETFLSGKPVNSPIWTSTCTFYGLGGSSGWSTPKKEADTDYIDIEFSPAPTNNKPNAPIGLYGTDFSSQGWFDPETNTLPVDVTWSSMNWRAERKVKNNAYTDSPWVITQIKGEKGDQGPQGPLGPQGPAGSDANTEALLDQIDDIDELLDDAIDKAALEKGRLDDLINTLDGRIRSEMEEAFADAQWWQRNYPEGQTGSVSNFGDADVEAYLQSIGVWARNGEGNITKTNWSTISQSVSDITLRVQLLEGQVSTGGDVNYSLLSSSLYTYINDNYTTAGLNSTWGKFMELSTGDIQRIKWMSSGVSSYANDAQTFAELMAAAADYDTNGTQIKSAAADIRALVERDGNDNLVAKSSMTSMVDDAISSIINTVTSGSAGTQIFSQIDTNTDDIAAITTKITGDTSSASVATKLGNMTSGLITTATADSAIASLIAMQGSDIPLNDRKRFYCEAEDTSATAASFTLASGQTISVGAYYSSSELATKCSPSTASNFNDATAPFLISGNSKKYRIVKVSSLEGALGESKLYAAILAGIKNDQSFIDMVAQNVTISADQIVLDGETWAEKLHVKELLINSIKDSDGNSIQVNYLMDKVKENSVYYAEVLNFIPGYDANNIYGFNYYCSTEFVLAEANKPAVLIAGRPTHIVLECASMYSLCGHIKVVMNGKNITGKYTTYSYDYSGGLTVNQVKIDIPRVDGNITITVDGIEGADVNHHMNYRKLYNTTDIYGGTLSGIPDVINISGITGDATFTGSLFNNEYETYNDSVYEIKMNSWALSSGAPSGISIANGDANASSNYDHPVLTVTTSATTGTFNIEGTTAHAGTTVNFPVTIISESSIAAGPLYLDFNIKQNNTECYKVNDASDVFVVYMGVTANAVKHNSSGWTATFSIDSDYSSYATCSSLGEISLLKPGLVPVTMLATVPGITDPITVTRWIYIKDKIFTSFNSTENMYVDIRGGSDRDNQFVLTGGNVILTKYITYNRISNSDVHAIYLYENIPTGKYIPTVTIDSANLPSWVQNATILTVEDRVYLTFRTNSYSAAQSVYNALDHAITIEDQQDSRQDKIVLNSTDGSSMTVYVIQSGNFGFYNILKDGVHGCISANYLTPKYYWGSLRWFAESAGTLVSTDLYPYAVLTPSSKWSCCAAPVGLNVYQNTKDYTYIGDNFATNNLVENITYSIE